MLGKIAQAVAGYTAVVWLVVEFAVGMAAAGLKRSR